MRPGVTYRLGAPVGPENTSEGEGGGGGLPLEIGQIRFSFYTSVHSTCTFKLHSHKTIQFWTVLYLGARGRQPRLPIQGHTRPYTIVNAGFGLMWEQLQSTQPFQSVVMSCTGHMAVVWLTKYREHYSWA